MLLCHVDVEANQQPLAELMHAAIIMDYTLILAWSFAEAARYIETFKAYEKKGATLIKVY